MAGGLFLGAIFMATDYQTSPINNKGKAFFALGCFIFFVDRISASYPLSKVRETRVLTGYMIIGCVILLGTAFILPRHRAVGRRPVLPD